MTAEELEALQAELGELETAGRSEIAARIKTAREWGDLKENAEYHAAKEAQAHLETQILRLREQVRNADVVAKASGSDIVQHGSTVTFSEAAKAGRTQTFKIVSPNDAKPSEGTLSSSSPVAQALVGHRIGDLVEVRTPTGGRRLKVEAIA
ncbi:MAG TPA: transcription elongation factor GreA [Solirubrobacteraceae bacterium]|nr:transcription elongation factor GreA [Solirubrobacteraceae bacterium]